MAPSEAGVGGARFTQYRPSLRCPFLSSCSIAADSWESYVIDVGCD